MLGNLGKLVVVLSILAAVGMLGLGVWTRKDALVGSVASGQTYREARIEGMEVSVMLITRWPEDQVFKWGRAVRPESSVPDPYPVVARGLMLLDGSEAMLHHPAATKRWPVRRSDGSAFTRRASATSVAVGSGSTVLTLPTTAPSTVSFTPSNAGRAMVQVSTSGTLTFTPTSTGAASGQISWTSGTLQTVPSTAPSTLSSTLTLNNILPTSAETLTLSGATPVKTPATVVGGSWEERPLHDPLLAGRETRVGSIASESTISAMPGGTVEQRGGKPPNPRIAGAITVSGQTLRLSFRPPYVYERYTVSMWLLAALVLLPAWWFLLMTVIRWRRTRTRRRRGLCTECGYDLRGNPSSAACPECGTTATTAGAAVVAAS